MGEKFFGDTKEEKIKPAVENLPDQTESLLSKKFEKDREIRKLETQLKKLEESNDFAQQAAVVRLRLKKLQAGEEGN